MESNTRRTARMIVSCVVSGVIAAGSVVLGSVSADGAVKPGTWLIAGVMGVTALCKDVQSSLSTPPLSETPPAHGH